MAYSQCFFTSNHERTSCGRGESSELTPTASAASLSHVRQQAVARDSRFARYCEGIAFADALNKKMHPQLGCILFYFERFLYFLALADLASFLASCFASGALTESAAGFLTSIFHSTFLPLRSSAISFFRSSFSRSKATYSL